MRVAQTGNNVLDGLETSSSFFDDEASVRARENEESGNSVDALASKSAEQFAGLDEQGLQDLIARIVEQDQVAFGAFFKAMSARVHSLTLRITGNFELAEEVTEDTFFQIWRQAPRFDPARGTAKTWIMTIARSRALDARRSIPPFESREDYETETQRDQESQDDLPDLLSAIEENHKLQKALESLESLPRQLIALSFFKGLSHEEISNHAGLPLGTVKSHLRRAIIYLREVLTEQTSVITNEK